MTEASQKDRHVSMALELANRAIAFDAQGQQVEAQHRWQEASDYADQHLSGEDIHYWIKSGLGAILFEIGDFQRAIEISELAVDWCIGIGQPLPSLTIARSYLKLGDRERAVRHVEQAYRLIGEEVFAQLDPADRDVMRSYLRSSS